MRVSDGLIFGRSGPATLIAALVICVASIGNASAQATTTLKCGNDKYEVSTGTKGGSCSVDHKAQTVECKDGTKNTAGATCSHGCLSTTGAGSCTMPKDRTAGPPSEPRPRGKPGIAVIPPVGGSILDREPGFGTQGPGGAGSPLAPAAPPTASSAGRIK
jgi:hypothetical protein